MCRFSMVLLLVCCACCSHRGKVRIGTQQLWIGDSTLRRTDGWEVVLNEVHTHEWLVIFPPRIPTAITIELPAELEAGAVYGIAEGDAGLTLLYPPRVPWIAPPPPFFFPYFICAWIVLRTSNSVEVASHGDVYVTEWDPKKRAIRGHLYGELHTKIVSGWFRARMR